MRPIASFFLVVGLFSLSFFSRQADAQNVSQSPEVPRSSDQVTVTETTKPDGTLVETIQIIGTLTLRYHGMFDFKGYLPDIVAPTIRLSLGQKMILKICPKNNLEDEYYDFFYFDPKQNNLSAVSFEVGETSLLKREWVKEPFIFDSWMEYCKIWNAEKVGHDVLSFKTTVTNNGGQIQNCWKYKLRLHIPVTVVDPPMVTISE